MVVVVSEIYRIFLVRRRYYVLLLCEARGGIDLDWASTRVRIMMSDLEKYLT